MIRHIVMWKFRPGTEAEQEQFLSGLRALQGVIPQLLSSEVARNVGAGNYDAVLVSEFHSLEGLDAFQRQLKRFDIKVKGETSDPVEAFFRTSDAAVLFPEYIARTVRQGMEEGDILPSITARFSRLMLRRAPAKPTSVCAR